MPAGLHLLKAPQSPIATSTSWATRIESTIGWEVFQTQTVTPSVPGQSRWVFSADVLRSAFWLPSQVLLPALLSQRLPGPAATVPGKMTSARECFLMTANCYLYSRHRVCMQRFVCQRYRSAMSSARQSAGSEVILRCYHKGSQNARTVELTSQPRRPLNHCREQSSWPGPVEDTS